MSRGGAKSMGPKCRNPHSGEGELTGVLAKPLSWAGEGRRALSQAPPPPPSKAAPDRHWWPQKPPPSPRICSSHPCRLSTLSTSLSHSGAAERPPRAWGNALHLYNGIYATHGKGCRPTEQCLLSMYSTTKSVPGPKLCFQVMLAHLLLGSTVTFQMDCSSGAGRG